MIKRLFILVVILLIVIGGLFWVLNSPLVTQTIVETLLKKHLQGYTLDGFFVGHQKFNYPDRIVFSNVRMHLKSKEDFYTIASREMTATGLSGLFNSPAVVHVHADQLSVESSQIKSVPGDLQADLYFKGPIFDHFDGKAVVDGVHAYNYQLEHVSAHLNGSAKHMMVSDVRADTYRGKISGQILLDWQKNLPYSIEVHFQDLDLRQMKDVNPSLYGQVEGVIDGSITVNGNTKNFSALNVQAKVTKDGRVNASLLKFVTPYIPQTTETVQLGEIIKAGGKVPVQVAAMELRSIDEHKLSGFVKLLIGQLNLDLNLPIDILYDGNLISLIQWYQNLVK